MAQASPSMRASTAWPASRPGYDFIAVLTDVAPDTGTDCGAGPFEGEYMAADGSPAGRLLCVLAPEGLTAALDRPRSRRPGPSSSSPAGHRLPGPRGRLAGGPSRHGVRDGVGRPRSASVRAVSPEPQRRRPRSAAASLTLPGASLRQWASQCHRQLASTGARVWSATQATGEPDTPRVRRLRHRLGPAASDGGPPGSS